MPDYPDIAATSETWQSADAVAETVRWQCRAGAVLLSTKAAPAGDTGTLLREGEVLDVAAGRAVSYRRFGGSVGLITREAFG